VLDAVVTALYGVVFLFIVGYFVGPTELGLASSALAFVLLVEAVTSAGMQDVVVRLPSADTRQTDAAHAAAVALSLAGVPVACAAAALYGLAVGEHRILPLTAFASVMLPLNAMMAVPTGLLIRKMRGRQLLYRPIIGKMLSIIGTALFAALGGKAWAVVTGSVLTSAGGALALYVTARRWPRMRFDRAVAGEQIRFGMLANTDALLWVVGVRGLTIVFAHVFGMRALGYLQFAVRLVDEMSRLLQSIVVRFALALFSGYRRAAADDDTGRPMIANGLIEATRLINAASVPVFFGMAVLADDFVKLVFGARWMPSAYFVQVLSAAAALIFARILASPAIKAVNAPRMIAAAAVFGLLTATAVLSTAPLFAATTVVTLWAGREIVAVIVWLLLARHALGLRIVRVVRALAPSWVSGGLMVAVLVLMRDALPPAPGARIPLAVMIGGGVYLAMLATWERRELPRLRPLAMRLRPRRR
jgi:O-antigen/teichoic acid export membrane protein